MARADDAVEDAGLEGEEVDAEEIARLCFLNVDGTDDDVGSVGGEAVDEGGAGDGLGVLQDLAGWDAGSSEETDGVAALVFEHAFVREGVKGDDGRGGYGEDGGCIGSGKVAPADGFEVCGHVVLCAGVEGCGCGAGLVGEGLQNLRLLREG